MIEVNLLPGGRKKRPSRSFSFSLPSFGGGGGGGMDLDRWLVGAIVAWIVALGYISNAWLSTSSELEETEVAIEQEVQDSIRFAAQNARISELRARRDSINDRIAVIQEIDQGRYVWPHVLDEAARALPDYTWLTAITAVSPEPEPEILIDGVAGTQFAVALFVSNLEASPFFRNVELINSVAVVQGQETVQEFSMQLIYTQPPFEELEAVPLFEDEPAPATTAAENSADGPGEEN